MIEGRFWKEDLTTHRLLAAIEKLRGKPGETEALSDCSPAPHWLNAVKLTLKADMDKLGLSREAQIELLEPVAQLMRTLAILYTDASSPEAIEAELREWC